MTTVQIILLVLVLLIGGAVVSGVISGLRGSSGETPVILAPRSEDNGAAMLAMVLAYHGKQVGIEELRGAIGGVYHALTLIEVARRYGLEGKGVKANGSEDLDRIQRIDLPAILHWSEKPGEFPVPVEDLYPVQARFVLFEGKNGGRYRIVDPFQGRRLVEREEVDRHFTGVALLFEKK